MKQGVSMKHTWDPKEWPGPGDCTICGERERDCQTCATCKEFICGGCSWDPCNPSEAPVV